MNDKIKKRTSEVSFGSGLGNRMKIISPKVDSARSWDVDVNMSIPTVRQPNRITCTLACKKATDQYFELTDQNIHNTKWKNQIILRNGVASFLLKNLYKLSQYTFVPCSNFSSERLLLPWVQSEMIANRVVQLSMLVDVDGDGVVEPTAGHNCIIKRIRYQNDFSRFKINLMNPDNNSSTSVLYNLNDIYQVFSVEPII